MSVTQQRMDKVTLGIIGCGHVSTIHLPLLTSSPRYEVRAMADVVEASAKQRAESFKVKYWSTDYHALLSDDQIEAVFVLTPPAMHAAIAVDALRAGKHVFCEKPLATTTEQCRNVIDAASHSDAILLLGYPMRFAPDAQNLRDQIQSGRIGRPIWFRDVWGVGKGAPSVSIHDAELGGGVLYEHTHWLDFVLSTFGPAKRAYAVMARFKPDNTTADDTFVAVIHFTEGDCAIWSESWAAAGFGWQPKCIGRHARPTLDIIGPSGSMHFPDAQGNYVLSLYEHQDQSGPPTQQWPWETDWGNNTVAFPNEHDHFYDCIRSGAEPRCTAKDGHAAIALAEAIMESSRTGLPVDL